MGGNDEEGKIVVGVSTTESIIVGSAVEGIVVGDAIEVVSIEEEGREAIFEVEKDLEERNVDGSLFVVGC